MKAIAVNGSPRKKWNTAQLCQAALDGAAQAGLETEFVHLYDYEFTGCRSCFACKVKNSRTNGVCAIRDNIRPVIERIQEADVLVVGSPVYFGYPTGQVRSLVERLLFPLDTYLFEDGVRLKVPHKPVQTAMIYTMNCPEDLSHRIGYDTLLGFTGQEMGRLYGYNEILHSCETLQVADYSRYDMNLFSEEERRERHERQFPIDLENACQLDVRLAQRALGVE